MTILRSLFWDWAAGRIGRLAFIVYSVAIWAALYGATLLSPSPFDKDAAPLLAAVLGVVALVASLNLAAKRFRDIGVPGWIAVIGATLVNAALMYVAPGLAYPWFSLVFFAALAATPSGLLMRG